MNMKRNLFITLSSICIMLSSTAVYAQHVTIEGEPCPLNLYESIETPEGAEENKPKAISISELEVYGTASADLVAVKCGEDAGYVKKDELLEALPEIDLTLLPDITGAETIVGYSRGDSVQKLQQNLITLKYLEDVADGQFGNNSAAAVTAFQKANGFKETGTADPCLQLAIMDAVEPHEPITTIYPMVYTADRKFKEIYQNTDADLTTYLDPEYKFEFDTTTDSGLIKTDTILTQYTSPDGTPDIDRLSFTITYSLQVTKNSDSGEYDLNPVMLLHSTGVFRPYVTSIALSAGSQNIILDQVSLTGSIKGITVIEDAVISLTQEAAEIIEQKTYDKITVIGRNDSW